MRTARLEQIGQRQVLDRAAEAAQHRLAPRPPGVRKHGGLLLRRQLCQSLFHRGAGLFPQFGGNRADQPLSEQQRFIRRRQTLFIEQADEQVGRQVLLFAYRPARRPCFQAHEARADGVGRVRPPGMRFRIPAHAAKRNQLALRVVLMRAHARLAGARLGHHGADGGGKWRPLFRLPQAGRTGRCQQQEHLIIT